MVVPVHLETVRLNAFRLCADAQLLFEHERWASCIALSVLVIEEVGKYLLLSGDPVDPRVRKLSQHPIKQSAVSDGYLVDLWVSLSGQIWSEYPELARRRMDELRAQSSSEEPSSQRPRITPAADEIQAIFEEQVRLRMGNLMTARFLVNSKLGETNRTKNQALYVDTDFNGAVRNDPARFTQTDAEEWLSQANRALTEIGYDE